MRILDIILDHLEAIEVRRDARCQSGHGVIAQLRDIGRRARRIGIAHRHDAAFPQVEARLPQRLRVTVGGGERAVAQRHQAGVDFEEMLAHDRQPAFRQQEVDVGHAAMLRVLDRDDRLPCAAFLDRIQCVLKREARQQQTVGQSLKRRPVRVRAGCALKRYGARGIGLGGGGHLLDKDERGGGIALHDARAIRLL